MYMRVHMHANTHHMDARTHMHMRMHMTHPRTRTHAHAQRPLFARLGAVRCLCTLDAQAASRHRAMPSRPRGPNSTRSGQVLRRLFPVRSWKWHKNVERLPALADLKARPVRWHKYQVSAPRARSAPM